MNESTTKKILFNKSSLLSLRAELLKKQEEVHEKKQLPQHKMENFKPASTKTIDKDEIVNNSTKKSFKDNLKAVDVGDIEANRKVKLALERKAELYEHLQDGAGNSQLASRFLVDFTTKKQQEEENITSQQTAACDNLEEDSEWVEFTDCLGRTRKCLKSDLEFYQKRDQDLVKVMRKDEDNSDQDKEEIKVEKPYLVQKTNDYLQSLREKWEQKEEELLKKQNDIHYQDLLFDEARMHGVGYYSFSTDETERRRQMEELMQRRKQTLQAQQEAEVARKKRDELLAARVAAARARARARAGLPPEEPAKENEKDFTTCLLEFLTQQKNEADAKAIEEEKRIREEKEKERQKLREAYVREWDVGKDGVEEKVKKFREMTQEEYVEQQRGKRIDEFAPPQTSSRANTHQTFDDSGKSVNPELIAPIQKTWSDVRPRVKTPPAPIISDIILDDRKGLYFSSFKNQSANMTYKNFVKSQESVPIENEICEEEDCSADKRLPEKRKNEMKHIEIAPPPTYDYYGPTPKQSRFKKPFESDIREAFAQGTKSLEAKHNDRQLSKQYDFTFD